MTIPTAIPNAPPIINPGVIANMHPTPAPIEVKTNGKLLYFIYILCACFSSFSAVYKLVKMTSLEVSIYYISVF